MLALYVNGNHIGVLRNTYAHDMAMRMCVNVGDSAILYTIDHYDYTAEECERIYYRNSQGVQESDGDAELDYFSIEMLMGVEKEPTFNHKLRDGKYAGVRTERTYGERDHKHSNRRGAKGYLSFIKRQERRSARQVGKEHIREQLAA